MAANHAHCNARRRLSHTCSIYTHLWFRLWCECGEEFGQRVGLDRLQYLFFLRCQCGEEFRQRVGLDRLQYLFFLSRWFATENDVRLE
jgi:hypothetical protein